MSFKKSFSSTFARIAFSLFLTSTAFAAPGDISFEISQNDQSITYSHDHLENYEFRSMVEALFGKDISWNLLNTLSKHICNGFEDIGNMYVKHGISYTYNSELVHKSLPKTYSYQLKNAAPKLVKAVFNAENESFDLTYQYYYGVIGFRAYYDFTVRVKCISLNEEKQAYFEQIKNIANADKNNIIVETKKEKPELDMSILGVNLSQEGKILLSVSSLEKELQFLSEHVELNQDSEEVLGNVMIALKKLHGILSEDVQLSSLNDIIELTRDLVFNLETLLLTNKLIEFDWYLYVIRLTNELADKFKEKQDNDAKKIDVMRSLQGAIENLVDRLETVAKIIAKYQDEDFSDLEDEEEVTIVEEEVVIAEQGENGSDNIIIIPPIAPPAPEILPVQSSNVSEQKSDMLAQIRAGKTLKKTVHQKTEITSDIASVISRAIKSKYAVLKNDVDSDSEEESWSSDEE